MDEQQQKWEGLFRGSVMSSMIAKNTAMLTSSDTRAQGLILLNSVLVPLAIKGMEDDALRPAALLSIITALITITLCIFCLYPKRLKSKSGTRNMLHYVEFSSMSEDEFVGSMKALFADKERLAEAAVRDLYHLGSRIVAPKYLLLRYAYVVFLVGQLTAALLAISKA